MTFDIYDPSNLDSTGRPRFTVQAGEVDRAQRPPE